MPKNIKVALLDYGAGNLRSAQRALERVGAEVDVTADPKVAVEADGLVVPGVGAFAACMEGLNAIQGPRIIGQRLAGSRPVLGICVGMQVMFDSGNEHGVFANGCGQWPGTVERLHSPVLPHMGWNTLQLADAPSAAAAAAPSVGAASAGAASASARSASAMFAGIGPDERFYFVHSYGVRRWELDTDITVPPTVAWANHGGDRFVAAVENGALWATQFHPEKSGDVGAVLLRNWLDTLR